GPSASTEPVVVGPMPTEPSNPAPAVVPHEGYVDVIIWPRRLRLGDEGALPLRAGDKFRIEAKVTPAAYLYLFWVTGEGEAHPVYPWQPGKWGTRPEEEAPRDALALPVTETAGYK